MFSARKRPPDGGLNSYTPCKSPKISTTDDVPGEFNRMRVHVRVRPLTPKESAQESQTLIDVIDQNMLVFDPIVYGETNDQFEYHGKTFKEIGKRPNKNLQFHFDRVFDDSENNITVYQETTKELVTSLLAGYNCSIFTYGSTGSGKTYTMLGSKSDPGIIFFTTMDLYKQMETEADQNMELSVSYFEIYNEIIYDLLSQNPGQSLSVMEDSNKGMTVKNLSVHQPKDTNDLLEMLESGNKNRKQHPTDANAESSRSHAIFQITLRKKCFSSSQEMSIQVSKMSLIDLAGSERATVAYKTYRSNGLSREGGNINKSLLALGNCINALANNNNKKNSYIPYRSSKLTLLLRDCLGGNCQTLMIATISPARVHYEETHNTLLYAERAKGVQLCVRKNNVLVSMQPRNYKQMLDRAGIEKSQLQHKIELLEQEVSKLKAQVERKSQDTIKSSATAIKKLNSVKSILDDIFAQRIELRAQLLECEHNLKLLELRLLFRKYNQNVNDSNNILLSIHSQRLHYTNMQKSLIEKIEENEKQIKQMQNDLLESTNNDEVVRSYLDKHNCEAQAKDVAFLEKHINKISTELCSRFHIRNEAQQDTFELQKRAFTLLKSNGLLSEEMENEQQNIINKLNGKGKAVVWRDNAESPRALPMNEYATLFNLPVYMSTSLTPVKRNLVTVRDITPLKNVTNSYQQRANLGNTITKGNKHTYNFPSTASKRINADQSSNNRQQLYLHKRTPERSRYQMESNLNAWSAKFAYSSSKKIPYRNNSSNYYGNCGSGQTDGRTPGKPYSYNPNFRIRRR